MPNPEYQKPFTEQGRKEFDRIFGNQKLPKHMAEQTVMCSGAEIDDEDCATCDHAVYHKYSLMCCGICSKGDKGQCVPVDQE